WRGKHRAGRHRRDRLSRQSLGLSGTARHRSADPCHAAKSRPPRRRGIRDRQPGFLQLGAGQRRGAARMSARRRLNASSSPARRRKSWRLGRNSVIALPYGWLLLFFILPFAFVLKISLAEADMAIPPYTALVEWLDETTLTIQLTLSKYQLLLEDRLYLSAYLNSLKIAAISTVFCLLIGFPLALFIVSRPPHARFFWLAMV